MTLAWLLLVTGLTISAVAIYYSVVGLAAIFAAASIPIIIMGTTLEVAKLVCASWLKANWSHIPKLMKLYMTGAVIVLMGITSMGIFGFLSKAHLDQAIPTGDIAAQVAMIDEKITTQKGIINDNRTVLRQLDEAVNQTMGRSTSEQGADRAVAIRKSQTKERAQANKAIDQAQVEVSKLQEQKAPIASKLRAVEAEVGPIKYIAAFVYGDNPDANVLEKAVTWVIIIIVSVFDPLAVIMLLAAQMTFSWHRKGHDPLSVEDEEDPYASAYTYDTFEKPTAEELAEIEKAEGDSLATEDSENIVEPITVTLPEVTTTKVTELPVSDLSSPERFGIDTDKVTTEQIEQEIERGEELLKADEIPSQLDDVERPGDYVVDDSKKKELHDQGLIGEDTDQGPILEYVQNQEQENPSSIWSKINQRLTVKPIDELYRLYGENHFADLDVDPDTDAELYKFLENSKDKPRFSGYPKEKLEYFVRRIYELRENNSNNAA